MDLALGNPAARVQSLHYLAGLCALSSTRFASLDLWDSDGFPEFLRVGSSLFLIFLENWDLGSAAQTADLSEVGGDPQSEMFMIHS